MPMGGKYASSQLMIDSSMLRYNSNWEKKVQSACVKERSVGPEGTIEGRYDDNSTLNSMIYDLEFPDGTIREYSTNEAENMLTQVDPDHFTVTMMMDS